MALEFTTSYLADARTLFRYYQGLGERAMAQLTDRQLLLAPDAESNSVALIVKHLAGNMRSRWTGFLTTDGEKPHRNRDSEFEAPPATREELLRLWNAGWQTLYDALAPLTDGDLTRTVYIRSEAHSVLQAINRQLAHYSYHVGQIVFLAKHLQSGEWKSLSVPRGRSEEFRRRVAAEVAGIRSGS
jgi:hypothetical protein